MNKKLLLFFSLTVLCGFLKSQDNTTFQHNFAEANNSFLKKNYDEAVKIFTQLYKIDSTNSNLNYKIGICFLYSNSEKQKALAHFENALKNINSQNYTIESISEKGAPSNAYYYYAQTLHLLYNFDRAIKNYEKYKTYLQPNQNEQIADVDYQIETCINAKELVAAPRNFEIKNLGNAINTTFSEYNPLISIDEKTLLFKSKKEKKEETFICYKNNDLSWTKPQKLDSKIENKTNSGITADGNTLFFASDAPGGLGGKDIWFCKKLPNGQWGKAQNIGAPINTAFDEESPFLHPSGNVLFFSSKGHKTIGGYDVFFSEKTENGWSTPLNIGYPINTTSDDLDFVTSPDGKRGYYATNRPDGFGETDIYAINFPERKKQPLLLIKGLLVAKNGKTLPTTIDIIASDNESGIVTGVYKPMKDGSFTIIIPPNSNYKLSYQINGEEFFSELESVPANTEYIEIEKKVEVN